MKKILLLFTFLVGTMATRAVTHTIVTTGSFTFLPTTTNANVGDTIHFIISVGHTATEVSLSTWTANGNTPLPGGFDYSSGGHFFLPVSAGTHYFVCSPHVSVMGMKGQINVSGTSAIAQPFKERVPMIYPNPASQYIQVDIPDSREPITSIKVINLLGSKVLDLDVQQAAVNHIQRIDITSLPRGIYFLVMVAHHKTRSIRFVKE